MRSLIASLFVLASCAARVSEPAVSPLTDRADAAMASLVAQGFAGSVLVACGDSVLFAGDYGLAPHDQSPSYWVASMSKQFTAAAILRLAEEGQLRLEDPLRRYFPEAPGDKANITLMQLLTHQSGLRQVYAADGVADRDAAAQAILNRELGAQPGTSFIYSNDNFTLLAIIVELVSRQAFEDYVREHVFAPAGADDAGFWPETGGDFVPPLMAPPTGAAGRANWGFRGGVGMRVSVRDLLAWSRALDDGAVLSHEGVALLYGPHVSLESGTRVGMGWFHSDEPSGRWLWTRGYDTSGGNAILYRLKDSPLTIIAATNAGPAEGAGPGWSRSARDAMQQIFDASSCGA